MSRENVLFGDVILLLCARITLQCADIDQRSTSSSALYSSHAIENLRSRLCIVLARKEESTSSLSTSAPKVAENDDATGAIGPGRPPSARVQRLLSRLSHLSRGGRSLRERDGEQLLPGQGLGEAV